MIINLENSDFRSEFSWFETNFEEYLRFLILGSASPELRDGVSESLARRVVSVHLAGFEMAEVGAENLDRLWVHGGAELDLLILEGGTRYGIEIKYSESPTITQSMRTAIDTLRLDSLWIVNPGTAHYPLESNLVVCGLSCFPDRWAGAGQTRS